MVLRKHVVKVVYLDYGSPLDTVWKTGTSIDGSRVVTDCAEYATRGAAEAAADAALRAGSVDCPDSIELARGELIERHCDINPHGHI